MSKCGINRESVEDVKNLERIIREGEITQADIYDFKKVDKDLAAELSIKYLIGETIPEEEYDDFIKDKYGEHWERYLLATKIIALSNANPVIKDMIQEYIWMYMPTGTKAGKFSLKDVEHIESPLFGKGGLTTAEYNKLDRASKLKQSLKVMSRDDLKVIYHKIYSWATAGVGVKFGTGAIGSFRIQFHSPKQMGQREYTGAYYKFTRYMQNYYTRIDNDVGNFWLQRTKSVKDNITGEILPKRFEGMDDVYRKIENLVVKYIGPKSKEEYFTQGEKMVEFFSRFMDGEIFYDKDSKTFMAYKDWGLVRDEKTGKYLKYKDDKGRETEDLVHKYSNPIPLSEFYGGRFNFSFSTVEKNKFLKITEKAREIDDRVFDYFRKKFLKSVDKIAKGLAKHFPDLTEQEARTLFFEEYKVIQHKKIVDKIKRLDKSHKKEYYKKYKKFKSTFGNYASANWFVHQAAESQYKKNHWPAKYGKRTFQLQWDNYIDRLEKRITQKEKAFKLEKDKDKKDILDGQLKELNNQLIQAINIKRKKEDDDYHTDTISGRQMPIVRDHKNLKQRTNAFDIRLSRKDGAVYYDHLRDVSSMVQRNLLTAELLESLALSKTEAVDDALLNYYKVPFNDPTTEGGIGPIKWSDEGIATSFLGRAMRLSPEIVNRNIRRINKWFTFSFLGGSSTAWVNSTAIARTLQDRNFHLIMEAQNYWNRNKEEVEAFITKSGVAAFQDFFTKSLVSGKLGMDVDNYTAERIYAIMLNLPALKEQLNKLSLSKLQNMAKEHKIETKGLGKNTLIVQIAKKETNLGFKKILNFSPVQKLRVEKILSKKEIESRLKSIQQDKIDNALDRLVEYTLTKEPDINRFVGLVGWKYKTVGHLVRHGLKGIYVMAKGAGTFRTRMRLTMTASEGWIRSTSFLAGILQAQRLGYIKEGNIWELTGKDLSLAMELGRLAANYSNMGLSSTDVGASAYGGLGNFMQKFDYWAMQQEGRDIRIIKNAIIVRKDLTKLKGNPFFDIKALTKMMGSAIRDYPRLGNYNKMNMSQKQQAQLLKFISVGVMPALALDLILWGPLGNVIGLNLIKQFGHRVGLGQTIRGLPSNLASMASIPLAMGIKMMLGMDDDDEGETARAITNWTRNLPLGYGGNLPIEVTMFLYLLFTGSDYTLRRGLDLARPLLGPLDNDMIRTIEGYIDYLIND